MDLFNNIQNKKQFQKMRLRDGELWFMENFLKSEKADLYFTDFVQNIHWKDEEIKIFGKIHPLPRKTAWYGYEGFNYKYSGILSQPEPWTKELLDIKGKIESIVPNTEFNSVLLNLYRNGNDKMGWHADNEKELGINPTIASLSLGGERRFDLKHRTFPTEKLQLQLSSGSLLIMKGTLQHHWLHQIPVQKKITEPRINLTFRTIIL